MHMKSALAKATLMILPPLIRMSILEDLDFQKTYELKVDPVITLGNSEVDFSRSSFFDAIREALTVKKEAIVKDTGNDIWEIKNIAEIEDYPVLEIFDGKQRLRIPDFTVLSSVSVIRIRYLKKISQDLNLPNEWYDSWEKILAERPLFDDEVDAFLSEFRDTSVNFAQTLCTGIELGESSVESLVPSSRIYYDRLIGPYNESTTINDYAVTNAKNLFTGLSAWQPCDGLLLSLLLSSHSSITEEIDIDNLTDNDLIRTYQFLVDDGDTISQLGAIEVGIKNLARRPVLEPLIVRLVENIRDDDVETSTHGIKLFSALFVLVDGELSRTRIMESEPPFYRRLASLTQASLIHRQLRKSGVGEGFHDWAYRVSSKQYYWQSITDMRIEPRWNPEFGSAPQIRADFLGRIIITASKYEDSIKGSNLHTLIFGADIKSIKSLIDFPNCYYPGPLEGSECNQNDLPEDISELIDKQLVKDDIDVSSFIALVNSAMIFRLESNKVDLAVNALKASNYRLSNIENKAQLLGILNGLATVAATSRNDVLASELRILLRIYWRDERYKLSIDEALRVCLIASASHRELSDWRECVGEWLTEFAFNELDATEAEIFHSTLMCLCHAVPELWVTCSKVDAALKSMSS